MDDREFLNKIRKIQGSDNKISLTEMTVDSVTPPFENKKKQLNRLLKESNLLNEDIQTLDAQEQKEEESKFKDIVSKLVKFEPIKVYPENVEWSGTLIREKIDWTFSLDDTVGCYIYTTELIQLRDEVLEVLKKLRGYYDVWAEEWSSRLTGTPTEDNDELEIDVEAEEGAEIEDEDGAGF